MVSLTSSTEAHVQGKYSAEKQEYLLRKQDTETFQSRLETLHISSGEAIDSVLEGKAKKMRWLLSSTQVFCCSEQTAGQILHSSKV